MSKRVAIITHSLRYNYGGILQNYALQHVLSKLGYSPITLKTFRKKTLFEYFIELTKYIVKKLIGRKVARPLSNSQLNRICINTDKFIDAHIIMTHPMGVIDKKWMIEQKFDAIVVGSDQVLHPASYINIEDVYLGFLDSPNKIMYAASFGTEHWMYSSKQTSVCKKLIKDFRAVGVRENTAQKMMQEHFGITPQVVLDPTLLLDPSDYIDTPICTGGGVVTYILDPSETKEQIAYDISKRINGPIRIAGNPKMDDVFANLAERVAPSVESWLKLFATADYIVTDSYHGTLFSIIFNKPFTVIANPNRALDRFKTVLTFLNLESRMVSSVEQAKFSSFDVDYDSVNQKIFKEKQKSLKILHSALS